MGDYSSTFTIVNKLDTSFSFDPTSDISITSGYLLRNGGNILSNSTSNAWQVKDKLMGSTEATLRFRESDKPRTSFEVAVACPFVVGRSNTVAMKSHIPGVTITAEGWSPSSYPLLGEHQMPHYHLNYSKLKHFSYVYHPKGSDAARGHPPTLLFRS